MHRKMTKKPQKMRTCFHLQSREKKAELLLFILNFQLKRSCGKNNNKNDNKCNNTNMK